MQGLNKIVELAMGDVNHHHDKQRRDNQRNTRLTRTATEVSLDDSPSLRLTPCMCDVDVVDQLKFMNERDRERQEIVELEKMARELGIDTWDDVAIDKPKEETKGTTSDPSDPEQPLVDEPLVDEPLVEQPPVEQPPVEQPPIDQPPVEQPPVEQTCTTRTTTTPPGVPSLRSVCSPRSACSPRSVRSPRTDSSRPRTLPLEIARKRKSWNKWASKRPLPLCCTTFPKD
jgi:hypothetical protein